MTIQSVTAGTYTDPRGRVWETLAAGAFQFRIAFRQLELPTVHDRGVTLEVYGERDGESSELLKFDCFEGAPHWHRCYPGLPDVVANLEPAGFAAAIDFACAQLRENFGPLISEQGFADLAAPERLAEVAFALPTVEHRARQLARDGTPTQVLRSAM